MQRLSLFHWMIATLLIAPLLSSCSPQPHKTIENLGHACQSEECAAHRYIRYAEQAQKEGLRNVANLLEALAKSEHVQDGQIRHFLEIYGIQEPAMIPDTAYPVETTLENLQFSVNAKTYKGSTAYPIFTSTAADEHAYPVEELFRHMALIAQQHAKYCRKAMDILTREHDDINLVNSWSVCPQCGSVYITVSLDENCTVCGRPAATFILFQ